jgi:hypothetical protein
VTGTSIRGTGVRGTAGGTFSPGVAGSGSLFGPGVAGSGTNSTGVRGTSISGSGVFGETSSASPAGAGVKGTSTRANGVVGTSSAGAAGGIGVYGEISGSTDDNNRGAGVRGQCNDPFGYAGYFVGDVAVDGGDLDVSGNISFIIDHPLDPPNKYLFHNAVESSERKNVYDGVEWLDEDGAASVDLPDWFEELNGDFRYQLTAVGGPASNLHVAEELSENRFKIAGGEEGMKVCWQVTGTRQDRGAAANPFEVEREKPEVERGRYLYPGVYDAPKEQRVVRPLAVGGAEEQQPPEPSGIDLARLEEEHQREIDELRRQEEEHRREMEELRRRIVEQQEEAPPEST